MVKLFIQGGTFDSVFSTYRLNNQKEKIEISAGTFASDVSRYCAPGYVCTGGGTSWTVEPLGETNSVAKVVSSENTTYYYATLKEALLEAPDNSTVQLIGNSDTIQLLEDTVLNQNKTIKLNLNNKTLNCDNSKSICIKNGHLLIDNGSLTIYK